MANEKRLIDAYQLWRYAMSELDRANKRHEGDPDFKAWSSGVAEVIAALAKDMPTVDAVEVVRCKDCRYCQRDVHGLWCFNDYEHDLQPDDFCSYGERKDNA